MISKFFGILEDGLTSQLQKLIGDVKVACEFRKWTCKSLQTIMTYRLTPISKIWGDVGGLLETGPPVHFLSFTGLFDLQIQKIDLQSFF